MGRSQDKIVQELIGKTYRELNTPAKPLQRSRMWKSPNGYIFLVAWSNASLLRLLVRIFTDTLPPGEYRLKRQLDDAGRSTVANIEEGFARPTTKEYLEYLGFSYASLKEVKGDLQRCRQDGFLGSVPNSSLKTIGIDLKDWHEALKRSVISKPPEKKLEESREIYRKLGEIKNRGTYRNLEEIGGKLRLKSFKFLYPPVDNLQSKNLTYEVFIELTNKTDWHLRKLVESLEEKLSDERKYYQVEQARIRGNFYTLV